MNSAMHDHHETTMVRIAGNSVDGLRHLSADEFRIFGVPVLAYLRESTALSGAATFTIHAADGTELIEVEALDNALELAAFNKMLLVTTQ